MQLSPMPTNEVDSDPPPLGVVDKVPVREMELSKCYGNYWESSLLKVPRYREFFQHLNERTILEIINGSAVELQRNFIQPTQFQLRWLGLQLFFFSLSLSIISVEITDNFINLLLVSTCSCSRWCKSRLHPAHLQHCNSVGLEDLNANRVTWLTTRVSRFLAWFWSSILWQADQEKNYTDHEDCCEDADYSS